MIAPPPEALPGILLNGSDVKYEWFATSGNSADSRRLTVMGDVTAANWRN
jgi:hypothetical protein